MAQHNPWHNPQSGAARLEDLLALAVALLADERGLSIEQVRQHWSVRHAEAGIVPKAPPTTDSLVTTMAREGEWLCADACAFTLSMLTPSGKINRRGFLERVAVRGSFPKPLIMGGEKKWKRSEVMQWAEDERKSASHR